VIIRSPPCVSFSSSNISGKADKNQVRLTEISLRIVAIKKYQPNSSFKAWYIENVTNSRNYLADYYTFNDLGLGDWAKKHRLSPGKKAMEIAPLFDEY
jgi:DNA (cytosine-5)-methyltransferase 1